MLRRVGGIEGLGQKIWKEDAQEWYETDIKLGIKKIFRETGQMWLRKKNQTTDGKYNTGR